jgi:hypothetical protein
MHFKTDRKAVCTVAGLIPEEVIEFFQFIYSFWPQYGPGVDSASTRNEYEESSLGIKHSWRLKLITSPPSVSRLSIKHWILNVSQPYRPPHSITRIGRAIAQVVSHYLPTTVAQA